MVMLVNAHEFKTVGLMITMVCLTTRTIRRA